MSDFQIIDENLRAAMLFFGEATGSGEIASLPGAVAIFSGLDYGVFNIAMLDGPIAGDAGALAARLSEVARFFKPRTLRWSLWLCEDFLDVRLRRDARQMMADFGLRTISHPPGMIAERLLPPRVPLPAIELRQVTSESMRRAFTELTSVAFEIPFAIANAVYSPERAWNGSYKGYVALAEGRPVAILAMVTAAGVLGVYSLATHPAHRRRGYGEALLRAAIQETRLATGIERVVLQSTEAGYTLYQRMGFRDATRFTVYLTK